MKRWYKITVFAFLLMIALIVYVNVILFQQRIEPIPQDAMTDINRMYQQLQQGLTLQEVEQAGINVKVVDKKDINLAIYNTHAKVRTIVLPHKEDETYYAFEYTIERIPIHIIWTMNIILLVAVAFLTLLVVFVYIQILRPFQRFEYIADALRNRDFTYEMPNQKSHFFGKFLWAVDVMRKELHHHEEKEMQLMKEHKLMIASISHDIKTPLSTIRLYSDTLIEDLYPKSVIRERVNENCDKIDAYIKELQQTNREVVFDFDVHNEEVYLHEIEKLLALEKERILLKRMKYTQAPTQDVLLHCDLHRLKEVLGNVVDNAIKYGDGKWIHIDFYEEEHHLIIKIENSGSGIDEVNHNAIFQSFYRGNNAKNEKGNGLGLYICKQFMKKMDGDIFMTQKPSCVAFHIVLEML